MVPMMGITMGVTDMATMMMTTAAPMDMVETAAPTSPYDYDTATFEIILPVIFGMFISLTLR